MTIKRVTDPINDTEIVIVEGKVDRILIKEAERTPKNIEYGVTHIASIQVDGQYVNFISLGIKEGREPNIAINTGTKDSPKWVQIEEGDDVKVVVTETIKGDKTYYNAKRTGIKLVKKGEGGSSGGSGGKQQGGSQQQYSAKPKDMSGISVGHSFNGAMNFLTTWGVEPSNENIVGYSTKVHNATEKLKAEYAKANPEMSAYDTGAAVGNSILNACKLVGTDVDFEQGIYDLANDFLTNVVPEILKHVKGGAKEAPPAKATRAPAKKTAATKAKPANKPDPEPTPPHQGFDDMDDDIPF